MPLHARRPNFAAISRGVWSILALMDMALLKMILLAASVIAITVAIAKALRVGSTLTEDGKRAQQTGRHCCLSGLAEFSESFRATRDDASR
jgi:hypothetical protein